MTREALDAWAGKKGMRVGILGVESLEASRARLSRLRTDGSLDAGFAGRMLDGFTYLEKCGVETPRSVIVAAMPRPAHVVTCRLEADVELVIPPTYVNYAATARGVCDGLRSDFGLSPRDIDMVNAPLKSLAALSGLTRWGRNNIGYVPGLGSYVQLMAFAVNVPLGGGSLPSVEGLALERCAGCGACAAACAARAIDPSRFLLHAERCYTLYTEFLEPIPAAVETPSPQCLIGCMRCQEACPENKGRLRYESTGIVFTREEAGVMLNDPAGREADVWRGIREKLAPLGVSEDAALYARNLRRAILGSRLQPV